MAIFRKIKPKIYQIFDFLVPKIKNIFDVRDFFVFGGLVMLGYGLYLFKPCVSFTVCGALLMIIGLFLGRPIRK